MLAEPHARRVAARPRRLRWHAPRGGASAGEAEAQVKHRSRSGHLPASPSRTLATSYCRVVNGCSARPLRPRSGPRSFRLGWRVRGVRFAPEWTGPGPARPYLRGSPMRKRLFLPVTAFLAGIIVALAKIRQDRGIGRRGD